jgi:hypothetical protein
LVLIKSTQITKNDKELARSATFFVILYFCMHVRLTEVGKGKGKAIPFQA